MTSNDVYRLGNALDRNQALLGHGSEGLLMWSPRSHLSNSGRCRHTVVITENGARILTAA